MPYYSTYELQCYAKRLVKYAVRLLELCEDLENGWEYIPDYDSICVKVHRQSKCDISRARYDLEESEEETKLWEDLLKSITQVTEKPVE